MVNPDAAVIKDGYNDEDSTPAYNNPPRRGWVSAEGAN
jgi:hypothetical protein